jgi:hypothetical protein
MTSGAWSCARSAGVASIGGRVIDPAPADTTKERTSSNHRLAADTSSTDLANSQPSSTIANDVGKGASSGGLAPHPSRRCHSPQLMLAHGSGTTSKVACRTTHCSSVCSSSTAQTESTARSSRRDPKTCFSSELTDPIEADRPRLPPQPPELPSTTQPRELSMTAFREHAAERRFPEGARPICDSLTEVGRSVLPATR